MVRLVLLRLSESFFRRWFLYPLPILVLLVSSLLYTIFGNPTYEARGAIYVQKESLLTSLTSIRDTGFQWVTPAQATMDEMRELIQTDSFVRAIIKQTDVEASMNQGTEKVTRVIDSTRKAISAQVLGSNLIQVTVEHEDKAIAEQVARALIESYIQWKINADREESISAQVFFQELVQAYQADLETARQNQGLYLIEHPDPLRGERSTFEQVQIRQLQDAVDEANSRLTNAIDKLDSANLALAQSESKARQSYLVIDAPNVPPTGRSLIPQSQSLKKVVINLALVAMAGVLLGIVGVAGAALLDSSYRFPIDVQNTLDLPVLAIVPDASQRRKRGSRAREVTSRAPTGRDEGRYVSAEPEIESAAGTHSDVSTSRDTSLLPADTSLPPSGAQAGPAKAQPERAAFARKVGLRSDGRTSRSGREGQA